MFKTIKAFLLIYCFGAVLQSVNAGGNLNLADYNESKTRSIVFRSSLEMSLARRGLKSADFCDENDVVSRRVLMDYGAIFLADEEKLLLPPVCIFAGERTVTDFQKQMRIAQAVIGGAKIELQNEAMNALLAARREAIAAGLNITPRDGAEAARRDYSDTLRLWNSRFFPALEYWRVRGKLPRPDAERLSSLSIRKQTEAVLKLEEQGIFFSKDFSKSILYSVAAPGTSQHLSLLAFDANEYANVKVRRILARHGWFRTVKNDLPHFTFLGLREKDLPSRSLRNSETLAVEMEGRGFLEAAHANPQVSSLIMRGISDLINNKSDIDDDVRQDIASRNGTAFAFEVLANLLLLIRLYKDSSLSNALPGHLGAGEAAPEEWEF